MFGQGEMVYNKDILVYKGRIIMYQKGIKRLLAVVLSACGLLVLSAAAASALPCHQAGLAGAGFLPAEAGGHP